MSEISTAGPDAKEPKLPLRDWILLPLLSLATIAVCLIGTEAAARHFFTAYLENVCMVDDARIAWRYQHNCATEQKTAEGPKVSVYYNNCGYRTKEPCGPTPPGTTRIALLGSSIGEGTYVDYDHQFSTRTASALTQALGRPVEVQNLSRAGCYPICAYRLVDEALALKPDVLVMVIDPYDVEHIQPDDVTDPNKPLPPRRVALANASHPTLIGRLKGLVIESSTGLAAEHFLFQGDSALYARMYLQNGDRAGYLHAPLSPAWKERLKNYEFFLDAIASKARAANVPVVLENIPNFAQSATAKLPSPPPQVDPYAFDKQLKEICERHGIQFVDSLPYFQRLANVSTAYYVVDTHPNSEGHALISQALVDGLLKEQRAALERTHAPQPQTGNGL